MSTTNTVAVMFPGVQNADVMNASKMHHTEVAQQEAYSLQKDYMRYFKPSWHIFHEEMVNLLFVFSDGTSELAIDADSLRNALKKAQQLDSSIVYSN